MEEDKSLPGWGQGLQPLDGLGAFYIAFTIIWTAVLGSGMAWMIKSRNERSFKLRDISFTISSLCLLHIYWIVYMLSYPLRGIYTCEMEFLVMSGVLPFSVAIFQANNGNQLLKTATLQKVFMDSEAALVRPIRRHEVRRCLTFKRNRLSYTEKTDIAICLGLIVQVCYSIGYKKKENPRYV